MRRIESTIALLLAATFVGPAIAKASQHCSGEVIIEMEPGQNPEDPPMPTGPATLNCYDPCEPEKGCQSFIITLVGPGGTQDAAACGCAGSGAPSACCQIALTPVSSKGGPVPWGECGTAGCPPGQTCLASVGVGVGHADPADPPNDLGELGSVGVCD